MYENELIDSNDLVEGMVLIVRDSTQVHEWENNGFRFRHGFVSGMHNYCGSEFVLTEDDVENFQNTNCVSNRYLGDYDWSLEMFTTKSIVNSVESTLDKTTYSGIISEDLKDATIKKMLKMVKKDYSTIFSCIRVSADKDITKEVVDKLLDMWAEGKWKMFLLFGEKFYISQTIERELDKETFSGILGKLEEINPVSKIVLESLDLRDVVSNKYTHQTAYLGYNAKTSGSKISGLMADCFSAKTTDWLAVNLFNKTKFTANLTISINPVDYLTMSINKSDWHSCHAIGSGCYSNGVIDLMIDGVSMVSYRCNDEQYHYELNNAKFNWNSKNWRQMVYLDVENLTFICSRQYPDTNVEITKAIRLLLEEQLVNYFELPGDKWKMRSNSHPGYCGDGKNYHDVLEGYNHQLVYYNSLSDKVSFKVGKDIGCIICGEDIDSGEESTCSDCRRG